MEGYLALSGARNGQCSHPARVKRGVTGEGQGVQRGEVQQGDRNHSDTKTLT